MKFGRYVHLGGILLALIAAIGQWHPLSVAAAQDGARVPQYKVDPWWPKSLPAPVGDDGEPHQWVLGQPGGTCIDSRDHLFAFNRGWQQGNQGKLINEGATSIPAPPVIEFDPDGNIVNTWGDATISPPRPGVSYGASAVLPEMAHGCFVDYEDNVWLSGSEDGVVQKWSHDGKKMLLQIGTKGVCDGPATSSPGKAYPTCGEPGNNSSQTLLNDPAGVWVDPGKDPVTGQVGSVYIADGYGNYRVVVFDSQGKYLRQMGSAGSGEGQFVVKGGGHPHCVVVGNDDLVYACDRGQNRIHVFDKMGNFKKTMPVDPPAHMKANSRATWLSFSRDKAQTWMFITDLGYNTIWIMNHATGKIVGSIGHSGRNAGDLAVPHTMAIDSKGNLYVAETLGGGRRLQKFLLQP